MDYYNKIKLLLEAKYKGIQFNRFGSDDDTFHADATPEQKALRAKRDQENIDRVGAKNYQSIQNKPEARQNISNKLGTNISQKTMDMIGARINSGNISDKLKQSEKKSKSPRFGVKPPRAGHAFLGTGEAFIRRPIKTSITGKYKSPRPFDKSTRETQRDVIAHEAAHLRLNKLPGFLSNLGRSETLASAYGGFRAPIPGSSFMSRVRSAGKRVREYGLPAEFRQISRAIKSRLPIFRKG